MADAMDLAERNPIARRFGEQAAAEWQVLLNLFALNEGFALIILTVPGQDSADLCRAELESYLEADDKRLAVLDPATPDALRGLSATLFALPDDPARGAVWVAAVPGTLAADAPDWIEAWRHALGSLNERRNSLRRRLAAPLILAGGQDLVPTIREIASDLWSVRSLSLRIEPASGVAGIMPQREPVLGPEAAPLVENAPDPDLAMRQAERLRGRDGLEQTLARMLARAGEGFAGRHAWRQAEQAWREAADLFGRFGPEESAADAWSALGDILVTTGRVNEAMGAFRTALEVNRRLLARDPGNAGWQRDLSVAYERVGDVLVAQGNLAEALNSYRDSLAIADRLARADPGNAGWQRDLSVAYNKVGDVLVAQGNLAEALNSYRDSLAIRDRLARADPGNAGWQRDLSVAYNKVGDMLVAQGNLAEALNSYRDSLAIADRLARADPGNAGWQRDLSVSYDRVGDVLVAQGNLAEALNSYRDSLGIRDRLARADPGNAGWQRDLSVSYDRVGDVQAAQGNLAEALNSYRDSLAIADRLARADPGNAEWQRDLSISLGRVAETLLKLGQTAEARPLAERALAQRRDAIARMPDDPRLTGGLPYYEDLLRRAGGTP